MGLGSTFGFADTRQRQRVDEDDGAAEPRRLDRGGAPGDPRADDAHVGGDLVHGPGGRARHRVQR